MPSYPPPPEKEHQCGGTVFINPSVRAADRGRGAVQEVRGGWGAVSSPGQAVPRSHRVGGFSFNGQEPQGRSAPWYLAGSQRAESARSQVVPPGFLTF